MAPVTRRTLLAASGAGAAVALVGARPAVAGFSSNPFQLGSASGDPTTDSVILWTRLAPKPTASDSGMAGQPDSIPVHWRVAETYQDVQSDATSLYHGNVAALKRDSWSVHLDVKTALGGGPLKPNTTYHYQLSLPDQSYRAWIGQTRTAPTASTTVNANFAVVTCQSAATSAAVNDGPSYWHGYTHLQDNPVHFVIHLGDYIYREGHENTVPTGTCTELWQYRARWGWYLSRDAIQRVRRLNPMYAVPDDHEVYNDYQGANIRPRFGEGTDWQLERFNQGMQAYWENMPVRAPRPAAIPGEDKVRCQISRIGLNWGTTLDLSLLDTRQFRTDPSATSPTLLGTKQLAATLQWIQQSQATWTALGLTTPLTAYYTSPGVPAPAREWRAYPAERDQITAALAAKRNPVAVAGDVHCPFVSRVTRSNDPGDPNYVATEFSAPPMSSYTGTDWEVRRDANPDVYLWMGLRADGTSRPQPQPLKGYLRCTATPSTFYTNFYGTHQTQYATGQVTSVARFRTSDGVIGAVPY
ncbi:MAG: alkaline phosphatase D family protein [Micromonosporaceae bacterium]